MPTDLAVFTLMLKSDWPIFTGFNEIAYLLSAIVPSMCNLVFCKHRFKQVSSNSN